MKNMPKMRIIACFLYCLLFSFSCSPTVGEKEKVEEEKQRAFPVIKLTEGPKQHWFGYYDKIQIDPSGRYALAAAVDTFRRSPTKTDTLQIGWIVLETQE